MTTKLKGFDNRQAYREGWGVFGKGRGANIQRLDDPKPVFRSDHAALAFVTKKVKGGSLYHTQALAYIGQR